MNKKNEYAEYLDTIIEKKFNLLEDEIKSGLSSLMDVYAEIRFITYLKLMKEDSLDSE